MKLLVSLLASLMFSLCFAQDDHYLAKIEQANGAYAEAAYDSALSIYTEVYQSGYESFSLYYNMANSFYKQGEIPSAILFYERAIKLNPSDKDAQFNIAIAQEASVDKIEKLPVFIGSQFWKNFRSSYTMDSWAWLAILFLLLSSLSFLLFIRAKDAGTRKVFFYGSIFCVSLFLLSMISAESAYNYRFKKESGIIFSPSITVQSAPAQNSGELFVLHEGTKVILLGEENTWYNIRLEDGNEGWVPSASIEPI